MYNVSQNFIDYIQSNGREVNVRISWHDDSPITLEGLETFTYYELESFTFEQLETMTGKFYGGDSVYKIDKQFDSDFFYTVMQQIDGEIKGRFDLKDKILKIELGVSFNGQPYEYVDFGEFIVKEHERVVGESPEHDKTTFKSYDKMLLTHELYDVSNLGVTFPISVFNLFTAIATYLGLSVSNVSIVNGLMMIEEDKWTGIENVTYRNVLDEIAQVSGSTIMIKNGELYAKYIGLPVTSIFEDNMRKLKMNEKYGSVNILNLSREPQHDNYVYPLSWETIPVDDRNEIVIADNQIMDKRRDEYAPALFNSINGIEYYPFEAETIGLAFIEPMDTVEVVDMNNVTYNSIIMHSRLVIGSGIKETLKSNVPGSSKEEYALVTDNQKEKNRLEILVDKQGNQIVLVASAISDVQDDLGGLGERLDTAEQKITPTAIVSTVRQSTDYIDDLGEKVNEDEIISSINQTAEMVKILANKIALEGLVTANSYFKVLLDGSIEAVNGKFSGNVEADSGTIGRFSISGDDLVYTSDLFDYPYDYSDVAKLRRILAGLITQTAYDLAVYDVNNSGTLTTTDLTMIRAYVEGTGSLTPKKIRSLIRIGTTSGEIKTSAVAQNGSVGKTSRMRADKLTGDLIDVESIAAKTLFAQQISFDGDVYRSLEQSIVVETGSNANGRWIKYGDGTMECFGQVSVTATLTSSWGGQFTSGLTYITLTYPQTFTSVDYIDASGLSSTGPMPCKAYFMTIGLSSGTYFLATGASTTSRTYVLRYKIVGRWKS